MGSMLHRYKAQSPFTIEPASVAQGEASLPPDIGRCTCKILLTWKFRAHLEFVRGMHLAYEPERDAYTSVAHLVMWMATGIHPL